jgi:mono/diheme cytochrome c family protein
MPFPKRTHRLDVLVNGAAPPGDRRDRAAKYGGARGGARQGPGGLQRLDPHLGAGTAGSFCPGQLETFLRKPCMGARGQRPDPGPIRVGEGRRASTAGDLRVPFVREVGRLRCASRPRKGVQKAAQKRKPAVAGSGAAFMLALARRPSTGASASSRGDGPSLLLSDQEVCGACHGTQPRGAALRASRSPWPWQRHGTLPYASAPSFLTTGDGYGLAWDAGLDFINRSRRVHPDARPARHPRPLGGYRPLTRLGAVLHRLGERFMERYAPKS